MNTSKCLWIQEISMAIRATDVANVLLWGHFEAQISKEEIWKLQTKNIFIPGIWKIPG